MRKQRRRGSAMLEFAIVGIPMLFVWISITQMALGMWRYHTLQYATKATTAFMALRGGYCSSNGNSCNIRIQDAAQVFRNSAVGIPPNMITVTFTPYEDDHVTAAGGSYPLTCTLNNCLSNTTAYPPSGFGTPGCDVRVRAVFTFRSALGMFVPGSQPVNFGAYDLASESQQTILF
jgi:hypothetical protein